MSRAQTLSDAFPETQRQRLARQRDQRKRERIALLRRQGRHGEADFLLLRDNHKLPESIRQSLITRFNHAPFNQEDPS